MALLKYSNEAVVTRVPKKGRDRLTSHILPVYNRSKLQIERGEGVYLYTNDSKRYLDFMSGIAVNSLGYNHPKLVNALHIQSKKVWHLSNLYEIPGMEELADIITENSFADKVFFCNSGAEAIECCIKSVRKYHDATGNPNKFRIITFTGAFHGRTLAAIWASKRDPMMQEGFGPPVEGFDNVEFNNLEAVKEAITDETAAILVEPIQGDGGIRPADKKFLKGLRKICNDHKLLLCFDEIQSGIGRTGELFAHEHYDVKPDIVTSAKGIGGGFPLGACLLSEKAAKGMTLGTHGSTYGGNPLAMAVGQVVMQEVLSEGFLTNVEQQGKLLKDGLNKLAKKYIKVIAEVRGMGLMLGLKLIPDNKEFVGKLQDKGLLAPAAADNVVRLLPPLIINERHVKKALSIIEEVCKEY
ncbi:MAG: acetylornithine transaminase [Alphaproteobacteria bacterium CG11_big_fil_rev_8_21_14_0_20_39_49]|nr:MAG: acetylornithine transaminase [Alphaproteobacteria bacterium CG11_big_fil_rev_8_21_14_0_20_39_49]